jgi:hypothetical protein
MKRLMFAAFIGGFASVASAQTPTVVTANSGIAFVASADHNVTVGGVAVVTSYQVDVIAAQGTTATGFSLGLGKPSPDASNTITVQPLAQFGGLLQGVYTMTVSAIGPGGNGVSAASDPFVRVLPARAPGKPAAR